MEPEYEEDFYCEHCEERDPNNLYYPIEVYTGASVMSYSGPTPPEYEYLCTKCYKEHERQELEMEKKLDL